MTDLDPFFASAQRWHDFYLLTGGAAATLTGLMFVAVSFGTTLVDAKSAENTESMRAFVDPPLSHFVHVLATACVVVMPTMTARVFGGLLIVAIGGRLVSLVSVYRQFRRAHEKHGDMERSDWVMGIGLPATAFLALISAGVGFVTGRFESFTLLGAATLGVLVLGVRSAWELMLWMVTEIGRRSNK